MKNSTRQTPSKNINDALWAEAFTRALTKKVKEPVGDGWLTVLQICEKTGLCRHTATQWVREELKSGRMERFIGSQLGKDGNPAVQFWYRPKA